MFCIFFFVTCNVYAKASTFIILTFVDKACVKKFIEYRQQNYLVIASWTEEDATEAE